jgi:hypothetical protein
MARTGLIAARLEQELAIERVLQNRAQALIREGPQLQGALAGRFQPLVGVSLGQTQDAETRAVAHFRMRLRFENVVYDLCGRRAHRLGPVNQARRSPFQMRLVALRAMFGISGVAVSGTAARMRSHTHTVMKDLDGRGGEVKRASKARPTS